MALLRGEMVSLDGTITYCTVEHHKVRVPTQPDHIKPEFDTEWDKQMKELDEARKSKL
jgi:acyl-coenzyme A thioesterase 13